MPVAAGWQVHSRPQELYTRPQHTLADPQQLLEKYANKGQPIPSGAQRGEPGFKEGFDTGGEIIGIFRDRRTGEMVPTSRGIIIYSKAGAHIVPVRPAPKESGE